MSLKPAFWAALWVAGVVLACTPVARAEPSAPPATTTQPAEIARLIELMSDSRYRVRQDAYDQLHRMGPGILELLYPYRNHPDPEVRARVLDLITGYAWLTRGVMIVKIQPGSPAEHLGFHIGDVVVRMNDMDIASQADIHILRATTTRTLTLWRAGRVREVTVPPGTIGFYSTNWDFTLGGENQSAGFAALAGGKITEAYARLSKALDEGMNDSWGQVALAGAAEYAMDHPAAMRIYSRNLRHGWDFQTQGEMTILESHFGLPLSGLHTAILLDRLKNEAASEMLQAQARQHLLNFGRNPRLAAEIKPPAAQPDYAAIHLALRAGKLKDALAAYAASGKDAPSSALAVQAAVRDLQPKAASDIAWPLVSSYVDRQTPADHAAASLWAVAAAAAEGMNDQVNRLVPNSTGLDRFVQLLQIASPLWRAHADPISRLAPFMMTKVVDMHLLDDSGRHAFARETLEMLTLSRGSGPQDWDRASQAMNLQALRSGEIDALQARFLLRHGLYEPARKALASVSPPYRPAQPAGHPPRPERVRSLNAARMELEAMGLAADFLAANAARLEKDWADLKGTIYLYAGAAGEHWAVRWDGQIVRILTDGKLLQYPGLAEGQLHLGNEGDRVLASKGSVMCLRRGQIYLLDEPGRKWVPTHAPAGDYPAAEAIESAPGLDLALRHVAGAYPVAGPGRETWAYSPLPGGWHCFQFGGNIALAVRPADGLVMDLGRKIASQAGLDKPVEVFRVVLPPAPPDLGFVPTSHGLWTFDAQGGLKPLPLEDSADKGMICVLPRPDMPGRLYAGLPPQQGGSVYEVDLATLKAALTKGYCPLGPDEYDPLSFAPVHLSWAIQAIHDRTQTPRR